MKTYIFAGFSRAGRYVTIRIRATSRDEAEEYASFYLDKYYLVEIV